MGVVYKAEDTHLDRVVAVKLPHLDLEESSDVLKRFKHEAKAAAALEHSSICAVYDYDVADDRPYLVMPFIKGVNLRDRIEDGPLPLHEALLIAIHVAEGLQEAHAHDVIHRDIKSSNIIITAEGQAKILDFGLAKILGATQLTESGRTVGTVSVMSPEQVRGEPLDQATDIWSLGVVIYEMVTGRLPFWGDYPQAICYAIQHHQHTPASELEPDLPMEVDWILNRALAKEKHNRYENAAEMLKDLRALRSKITTGQGRDIPSWFVKIRKEVMVIVIVFVAVAAVLVMAYLGVPPFPKQEEGFIGWFTGSKIPQGITRRITAEPGWSGQPAISPSGTRIAYVSESSGNRDIYVVDARGGEPLQLTSDPAVDEDPTWLPDEHAVVFTSHRGGGPSVWRIGQLGGGATKLIPNAEKPAVSPDGKRIAFTRVDEAGYERIWYAETNDLTRQKQLTTEADGLWWQSEPVWSPDNTSVCYTTRAGLRVISVDESQSVPLTKDEDLDVEPVWGADGRFVYFSSYREGTRALWRVKASGGKAKRVTLGTGPESHPSLSRDRHRLAYTTEDRRHGLVVLDLDTGEERDLPHLRNDWMPALAPDCGSVVFQSDRWGTGHVLWLQELDGAAPIGGPRRLTTQPGEASFPAISPDGKWLAYYRILDGRRDIMVMSLSTGQPQQFTDHPDDDVQPTWSPDATQLAFISKRSGSWQLWIAGIKDGRPQGDPWQLTDWEATAMGPSWSPDGGLIAFLGHQGNRPDVFVVAPVAGSLPRRITRDVYAAAVAWNPATGNLLVAAPRDGKNVSLGRYSPAGQDLGPTRYPVVFGESTYYTRFAVCADGRLIVYVRQRLTGDVWLLESEEQPY